MPNLVILDPKQKLIKKLDPVINAVFTGVGCLRPPSYLPLAQPKRILFLDAWSIGDVVLSTPALISLRQYFPSAKISVLGRKHVFQLLQNFPWVDEIIVADIPWTRPKNKYRLCDYVTGLFPDLVRDLRKRRFDLALDGQIDIRGNWLLWLSGAKRRVGYGQHGGGYFLTDKLTVDYTRPHSAQVFHRLVEYVVGPCPMPLPTLVVSPEQREAALRRLKMLGVKPTDFLLAVHPGGGHPGRRWGIDRYAAVVKAVSDIPYLRVISFVEPDGYGTELQGVAPVQAIQVSLEEMVALLSLSDLFLGADSGPMHIAAAVGTPLIGLFGSGELRAFAPWGEEHEIIFLDGFRCRPCGDRCKFDQPYCMSQMHPAIVVKALRRQIDRLSSQLSIYRRMMEEEVGDPRSISEK